MNDTRDPAQNGQTNVDQEITVAASLEEDGERWQEERQEVEAHVGSGGRHDGLVACGCGVRLRMSEGRIVRSCVEFMLIKTRKRQEESVSPTDGTVYVLVC
jgi:hypothetical protein